jgi:hypothetical protein
VRAAVGTDAGAGDDALLGEERLQLGVGHGDLGTSRHAGSPLPLSIRGSSGNPDIVANIDVDG